MDRIDGRRSLFPLIFSVLALLCGAAALVLSLVWMVRRDRLSVYGVFTLLGPVVTAALLLLWALRPGRGRYRAVAVTLLVLCAVGPPVRGIMNFINALSITPDWRSLLPTPATVRLTAPTLSDLSGALTAALGILLMMEKTRAVRVVALVSAVVAAASVVPILSLLLNPLYMEQMGSETAVLSLASSLPAVLYRIFSLLAVYGMEPAGETAAPAVREF